ncbi:MAG: pyridoxal phosphate-dependent aminotransferase [Phycisphaerae bacterium]
MKLARRVTELAESATLAVTARAARMKADGIDVLSFAAGEPDFDTPEPIKSAGIAAIESGQTRYPKPASGIPEVKRAVCERLQADCGLTYQPDQVIVTSGGKMAVYLAIQVLIDPGDEAVIPRPYWVSYPEIVKLAGGVPVFVAGPETSDYKLTPELLASALTDRTRVVLYNSPCNPSGVTYHPDETRALADVLADRELTVISDEIYNRLLYGGQQVLSFAACGDAAYRRTLTLNSASKTYAMTGWRLGFAAGPAEVIKAMAKLQSQTTSGAATFNQAALAEALTVDQSPVERMRAEFERRGHHMHERLCAMPGVRCPRPTGAFYCFPNVSGTYQTLGVAGSVAFCERLLEQARVAAVPGVAFGMDEHVRLSFATGMAQIEEGLDRVSSFVGSQ